MFRQKQLPVWVTFAVELLFASQDILGDEVGHAYVDMALHLQKLARQNNRMVRVDNTVLPDPIYDIPFQVLGKTLQRCQDWVLFNGYKKQWKELSTKKQISTHPVLRKLLNGKPKGGHYVGDNALICGMLKYEIYLKYRSAGLQLEQQSLSISMLAHIYVTVHLEHERTESPGEAWPDMEYVLYA
jgi:hypothetical protein